MRIAKSKLAAAFIALTALVAAASAAWACTAQTYLNQVIPRQAVSRSTVSLAGQSTVRQGLVEIRWNSAEGPRVDVATTGSAANFSRQVMVPDVAPGVYYLVVVSEGQKIASAPFEVTESGNGSSAVAAASGDLWGGFDQNHPSIGGLGGISQGANGPKSGLLLGAGLLAVGAAGLVSAAVVTRSKRRAAQAGKQ